MLYNSSHNAQKPDLKALEALEALLLEVKVLTRLTKSGLNVADEIEDVRDDVQQEAE